MKKTFVVLACLLVYMGTLYAQADATYIVLDGKGGSIDSALADLLLDKDVYQGKLVALNNVIYPRFGVASKKVTFYKSAAWFNDSETYKFLETDFMRSKEMIFFFQPLKTDRDMRKALLGMDGKYYMSPQTMTIRGKFVEHKLNTGLVLYLFLVDSFEVLGKKYTGLIPDKVTSN
jgi:hypothetical protein